jgi:hypothetical protein
MRRAHILLGGVSAVSLIAGGAVGYFVAWKRISSKYEELVASEIEEAKKYYARKNVAPKPALEEVVAEVTASSEPLQKGVEDAANALLKYRTGIDEALEEEQAGIVIRDIKPNVPVNNVFRVPKPTDVGQERREPGYPYEISEEEYNLSVNDYEQLEMTYYAGDDVLADDKDEAVDAIFRRRFVGDHNLQLFGEATRNELYVRNDAEHTDTRISRSTGSFAREVAGFD